MKAFFPESLAQKCRCTLYMGAHWTRQIQWIFLVRFIGACLGMDYVTIYKLLLDIQIVSIFCCHTYKMNILIHLFVYMCHYFC